MPTATAFGRTIRFISKEYAKTNKGVLGVDVGATTTTVAAAFAGDLVLSVSARLGVGEGLTGLLSSCAIEDITRWLSTEATDSGVRDYIYNKALYPSSLPVTAEELAIEQTLECQALYLAVRQASRNFPSAAARNAPQLLPWFEPIIAAGSVLTQVPGKGRMLMTLLNALQPTGITTIALDRNNLRPSLVEQGVDGVGHRPRRASEELQQPPPGAERG